MSWQSIAWLNPTIPIDATTIPKGNTVCIRNGAPPTGLSLLAEPGAPWVG